MNPSKSIFLFRRDLRLHDNKGLIQALQENGEVIPVFNFDPRQTSKHAYFSQPGFQFLIKSLEDLDHQLGKYGSSLQIINGLPQESLLAYAIEMGVQAVYANRDYTPFSIDRDRRLKEVLAERGIAFHLMDDALLVPPELGLKDDGTPYTVFTPFYRRNASLPVSPVEGIPTKGGSFSHQRNSQSGDLKQMGATSKDILGTPGRTGALALLKNIGDYQRYEEERDLPGIQGTTRLSAHLKFGTCSIREAYHAMGGALSYDHPLIRQLYWRDFYTHIAYHFPHVFGSAFKRGYDRVEWEQDQVALDKWENGETGFPIVDAGIRELLKTGFMHNRVRMIVASFLTKDLLIDWREGERFFSRHLVDYDPCVNNGNWQWSASTGCDAQPYFRIFNPWLQQRKFDPDAAYIKKWVPELKDYPAKRIHQLDKAEISGYPAPMIDHSFARMRTIERYKQALQ